MTKQYRSDVMASIHETAEGLHAAGVMDKQTMRKFDEAFLTPFRPLTAAEIKALRRREGASQAVFARYLSVTTGLVSQWKRGEKQRPPREGGSMTRKFIPVEGAAGEVEGPGLWGPPVKRAAFRGSRWRDPSLRWHPES